MPVRTSNRGARANPESTTTRTPSTVSDVSAMSVDRTTRRRPGGDGAKREILVGQRERAGQRVHVRVAADDLPQRRLSAGDLADAG